MFGSLRKFFLSVNFLVPLVLLIGSFLIYFHNLSPSVYGGDVGDLVTAAYLGGVAHAPGYPLFMILGFILSHIPLSTPAFMVGLISCICGAGSVVLVYVISKILTKNTLISILTSGIFAFCYLFWFYAEIAEVFALHVFFISLIFYLSIMFRETRKKIFLFLLSFFIALSAANHQTTIFFLPSVLILTLPTFFKSKKRVNTLIFSFVIFVITFSLIYSYIFIASSQNPPINWDHVHDFSSFLRLFLRRDYGTFNAGYFAMPTLFERWLILKSYLFTVLTQLTIPVIVVSLIGLIYQFVIDRIIASSIILGFILSGPVFISYSGFPLTSTFLFGVYERFFGMSALMIILAFPLGLKLLSDWFGNITGKKVYKTFFILIFFIIPIELFLNNFPKTNLSNLWVGDNLGYDILSPLPKNAVLFMGGDTALFNTWYVHFARNFRPDVQIVNMNGLVDDRYMLNMEKNFRKQNPKIHDPNEIIIGTIKMIEELRPVFSATQLEGSKEELNWSPFGIIYKLVDKNPKNFVQTNEKLWSKLHIPYRSNSEGLGNLTISEIPTIYSSAFLDTGIYIQASIKDNIDAKKYYEKAIKVDNTNAKAYLALGLYNFTVERACENSINNIKKSISLDNSSTLSYFLLYSVYTDCQHDKKSAQDVANDFKLIFGKDFFEEAKNTLKNSN